MNQVLKFVQSIDDLVTQFFLTIKVMLDEEVALRGGQSWQYALSRLLALALLLPFIMIILCIWGERDRAPRLTKSFGLVLLVWYLSGKFLLLMRSEEHTSELQSH